MLEITAADLRRLEAELQGLRWPVVASPAPSATGFADYLSIKFPTQLPTHFLRYGMWTCVSVFGEKNRRGNTSPIPLRTKDLRQRFGEKIQKNA
jgi:hypothetical protein